MSQRLCLINKENNNSIFQQWVKKNPQYFDAVFPFNDVIDFDYDTDGKIIIWEVPDDIQSLRKQITFIMEKYDYQLVLVFTAREDIPQLPEQFVLLNDEFIIEKTHPLLDRILSEKNFMNRNAVHELNNHMALLNAQLNLMARKYNKGEDIGEFIDRMNVTMKNAVMATRELFGNRVINEVETSLVEASTGSWLENKEIVLVEDNEDLRTLTKLILNDFGLNVRAFQSGEATLKEYVGREDGPYILLTDLMLPGMSGDKLAKIMRSEFRDLKVVFLSGKVDMASSTHYKQWGDAFAQKPVLAPELHQILINLCPELAEYMRSAS